MLTLFQTHWHNVDLVDVARDPRCLTRAVPNQEFYSEVYRRLRESDYILSPEWVATKEVFSGLLAKWLDDIGRSMGRPARELQVLSVGAGLGIVELPLVTAGYAITLHEVQEESLEFARRQASVRGIAGFRTIVGPLGNIDDSSFDVVYLGTCEYCYTEQRAYQDFADNIARILVPGGLVVAMDMMPTWRQYAAACLDTLGVRRRKGVRWGKLRRPGERALVFNKAGFDVYTVEYWNHQSGRCLAQGSRARVFDWILPSDTIAVLHARRRSSPTVA